MSGTNDECSWKPCGKNPTMRVFYPSPEDYWAPYGDYCEFHFGVIVFEGRVLRNWRAQALADAGEVRLLGTLG